MATDGIISYLTKFAALGTKFVVFSGGEPLLREDLGTLVSFCKEKSLHVSVNTNGSLIRDVTERIENVDEIQLSLDGPRHIHDALRGAGQHDRTLEALKICLHMGIRVNLSTVICGTNIRCIPEILALAEDRGVGIYFHPADPALSGDSSMMIEASPRADEYREAIRYLIRRKAAGCRSINNSVAGLRHLLHWPNPRKIFCLVSLLCCYVEPDGAIFVCDSFRNYREHLVTGGERLGETFARLSLPHPCDWCWCGSTVEFNLLGSFRPESMIGMWRRFRA